VAGAASHRQGTSSWRLFAAAFGAWLVLVLVGVLLLPAGGFRFYVWPILAGVIVLVVQLAVERGQSTTISAHMERSMSVDGALRALGLRKAGEGPDHPFAITGDVSTRTRLVMYAVVAVLVATRLYLLPH
jgi:hypothetical protein